MPIPSYTPLIVKFNYPNALEKVQVLYPHNLKVNSHLLWTHLGWTEITSVTEEKLNTNLNLYSLHNRYNWLHATEDTKIVQEEADSKANTYTLSDIDIRDIQPTNRLLNMPFPLSLNIDVPPLLYYPNVYDQEIDQFNPPPNIYCDNCETVIQPNEDVFHCQQCLDFDLCVHCHVDLDIGHLPHHKLKLYLGEDVQSYINMKSFASCHRYWNQMFRVCQSDQALYPLWSYSGRITQMRYMTMFKAGFNASIQLSSVNLGKGQDWFSPVSLLLPTKKYLENAHSINYIVQPFNTLASSSVASSSVASSSVASSSFASAYNLSDWSEDDINFHINNKTNGVIFNREEHSVYRIQTANGYYQAGIGRLILSDKTS